ncbi:MAG: FtsX-like permease family protein [Prevotellaceae bacterium]|jgi:ABC-type lipoprotein release transport system permease subunit|nr:FtsX-like permease family protein [Prevotellaceae bacterium]
MRKIIPHPSYLILHTSFRNIIGAGKRTWLNVTVLSFTFVMMVIYNGLIDGWQQEAYRDTENWETGAGQIWHPQYDRFDVFTLQDAHATVPTELQTYVANRTLTPILITQGVVYPQGRMQNILLKGIDPNQQILSIPSQKLSQTDEIYVLIGSRMAKSTNLKQGDRVMIRWRDKNGVFDALEILIADIFDTKVPSVDAGQIWLNLHTLQKMTGMPDEATCLIKSKDCPVNNDVDGWSYRDVDFLTADIRAMIASNRAESVVIFSILLAIALLAVFDTQTLAIFRRRKEIGTYIALGMTPKQVIRLFTLEGTSFSILAILAGCVWGTPLLLWFAKTGFKMPEIEMDAVMGDTIYPAYELSSIVTAIVLIVCLSALISYLPARKIAKQNVVNALKGKL